MTPSQNCIDIIKSFEGFRTNINKDPVGILEIGYGHKLLPGETFPDGLDVDKATELLNNDLMPIVSTINSLVTSELNQNQFDALCSLVYNIGCGAFRNSTILSLLNDEDFEGASNQFVRWDHAGGVVLSGLLKRRNVEKALFLTPVE